jgi:uncharacterized membrane protein
LFLKTDFLSDLGGNQMNNTEVTSTPLRKAPPEIKQITNGDVWRSVSKGWNDVKRASVYSLFFGIFYAAAGWALLYMFFNFEVSIYAYPVTMGFPLIAPFIAAGLYEISRRIERGDNLKWAGILGSVRSAGGKDLSWMAVLTTFAYILWVDIAAAIYVGFFGLRTLDVGRLLELIFTTPKGLMFFVVGNLAGLVLGAIMFSLTSVSFPLLFDRNVDFVTAMITSVKAVMANKIPMILWACIIVVLMTLSIATMFAAMIVILPLLGHTTWHLYRSVVVAAKT